MTSTFQIAIDGPTASGKGTVAKKLSRKLGLLCLDTGALYRAVTVHLLDNKVNLSDHVEVFRAIGELDLSVKCIEGSTLVFLNGVDVTSRLRTMEVHQNVFWVAKVPEVRVLVRQIQTATAERQNIICEGRDITTVVFPNARFKFYLTASLEKRAGRRYAELAAKDADIKLEKVTEDINARDDADMRRTNSPLKVAHDAILIDATDKSAYDVVMQMEKIITRSLSGDV